MQSDTALQTLLRALPAILVALLGLLAVNDVRTRRQWSQFLFSIGSLRADERDDVKKQSSVKYPFFFMALCLLWWPVSYFRHATRKIEVVSESELFKKPGGATPTPKPTATPKPTPSGPTPPPAPLPPGSSAPAPSAPSMQANPPAAAPQAAKTPPPDALGSGPHL